MTGPRHSSGRPGVRVRRLLSILLASLLALIGLDLAGAGTSFAARADAIVLEIQDGSVIGEGKTTFTLTYDTGGVAPGESVVLHVDGLTIDALPIDPAHNDAITSATVDKAAGTVTLTFADPLPPKGKQGVLGLEVSTGQVDKTEQRTITWWTDTNAKVTPRVTIREEKDSPRGWTQSDASKSAGQQNALYSAITVQDGRVRVDPALIGKPVPYELVLRSVEGVTNKNITDTLSAPFTFVPGSFSATLVSWDAQGYNRTESHPAIAPSLNGQTATIPVTIPSGGELKITYSASIADEAARAALERIYQEQYDALSRAEHGGQFGYTLKNTAETPIPTPWDPPTPKTVESSTWLPQVKVDDPNPPAPDPQNPNPGNPQQGLDPQGVSKKVDRDLISYPKGTKAEKNARGLYDVPDQGLVYTLGIDLAKLTRAGAAPVTAPLVIEDTLPEGVSWAFGEPLRLSDGTVLTKSADASCGTWLMTQPGHERTFCVNGRLLVANLGAITKSVSLEVGATLEAVAGEPQLDQNTDARFWNARNIAQFIVNGTWIYKDANTRVIIPSEHEGEHDKSVFDKTSTIKDNGRVVLGEATSIDYTLSFHTSAIDDLSTVAIVDPLDTAVFDLSEKARSGLLSALKVYSGWWPALDAADYSAVIDAQGVLRVSLTPTGIAHYRALNQGQQDPFLRVAFTAQTLPFTEKTTLAITNHATVVGESGEPRYWSESTQTATSWGDEAEYSKSVRDFTGGTWADSVRAELDADGRLVNKTLVYRISFIPHGSFGTSGVRIIPIRDVLPEGTSFAGFIDEAKAFTELDPVGAASIDLPGNLQGVYEAASAGAPAGTVILRQKPGTRLDSSKEITLVFAARYEGRVTEGVPIINVAGTTTTVTPGDGFPLTIAKVDAKDPSTVITDHNARFLVRDEAGVAVLGDTAQEQEPVFVDGGYLRTFGEEVDGKKPIINLLVPKAGSYTVEELIAPVGYLKTDARTPVSVNSAGVSAEAEITNTPDPNPRTGSVSWSKTDAETGEMLAGSTWRLKGRGLPEAGVLISDCTAPGCSTGQQAGAAGAPGAAFADSAVEAGVFTVTGLALGAEEYSLVEEAAPVGYQRSDEVRAFTVTADAPDVVFERAFPNSKQEVPPLPLTGGASADAFLIVGGGMLALALLAGLARRRSARA